MTTVQEGERVRCLQGNIDKNLGAGLIGIAYGDLARPGHDEKLATITFPGVMQGR